MSDNKIEDNLQPETIILLLFLIKQTILVKKSYKEVGEALKMILKMHFFVQCISHVLYKFRKRQTFK